LVICAELVAAARLAVAARCGPLTVAAATPAARLATMAALVRPAPSFTDVRMGFSPSRFVTRLRVPQVVIAAGCANAKGRLKREP
jgi:hypothetical protein